MSTDAFVQVAPDSTGKQVDMAQVTTLAGTVIYRQRAELTDPVASAILEMNATMTLVLANLRGILQVLSSGDVTEDNFIP
jgi:hypothetical protein